MLLGLFRRQIPLARSAYCIPDEHRAVDKQRKECAVSAGSRLPEIQQQDMRRNERIKEICKPLDRLPLFRLHFSADLLHGKHRQRQHDCHEQNAHDQIRRIRMFQPARKERNAVADGVSECQDCRKDGKLSALRHELLHQR